MIVFLNQLEDSYQENKSKLRNQDEDIHSQRFEKNQTQEDQSNQYAQSIYKYILDQPRNVVDIDLSDINIINVEDTNQFHKIPRLAHNLEAIVHKPGVYTIESMAKIQPDQGQFLKKIYQSDEIDLKNIPPYIKPSEDKLLLHFAEKANIKYIVSTSTVSQVLNQLYYLFGSFRNPNFTNISDSYASEPKKYMISQRKPITFYLKKQHLTKQIYAIDSDKGLFNYSHTVLMDLGKIVERSLTMEPDVFKANFLKKDHPDYKEGPIVIEDDYHRFMKLNNNICLRSQIDCAAYDTEGKPFVFEIKTRAICPMRYDLPNYQDYFDYQISTYRGLHSSFEREYYDLIRGAFMKYCFQLKIGRMDGAFIAYHNTRETYGFEYVKTKEIESRVFGNSVYSDVVFTVCTKVLTRIMDDLLKDLEGEQYKQLKVGFFSHQYQKRMVIFVELQNKDQEDEMINSTEQIKDEYDYYTKFKPLNTKVFKYEVQLFTYINNVLQELHRFFYYHKFMDYMNFLHDAYKMEAINLDLTYSGAWMKS